MLTDAQVGQFLLNAATEGESLKSAPPDELFPDYACWVLRKEAGLRYGENPHQRAALYSDTLRPGPGWARVEQLHGKELSYNNYLDMDAAWQLVTEFDECACAIIKHANPCGAALGDSGEEAFARALECDPESAFGSIIARDALRPGAGWGRVEQLHGKELSYNNYLDMDAAWQLATEFDDCACVIIKHANPCGAALGDNCEQAFARALECDPESAFGSIIAFNRPLDGAAARAMSSLFLEVVIAPDSRTPRWRS